MVQVQCQHRRARFRVIWSGSPAPGQIGLECLEPDRNIFGLKLPDPDCLDDYVPPPKNVQRRAPRFTVAGGAEVRHINSQTGVWTTLSDLSSIGCYCKTKSPFPIMTRVRLVLRVDDTDIDIFGVVRSVQPGIGMGIEFTQPSSTADSDQLTTLVERLRAQATQQG